MKKGGVERHDCRIGGDKQRCGSVVSGEGMAVEGVVDCVEFQFAVFGEEVLLL